ncbi:AraC family transcriptional regulator [Novosphingobium sp.]|uniref:AraC family transcriptional regulator n=1 Tax=Novosphingobium sp. TaxID=1874826 RepID=UPI0026010C97|nr:AraC family transcriptional regulator [Novosphingobium sp.]
MTDHDNMLMICAMPHLAQNTSLEPLFRFAATLGIGADDICDAIGLDLRAATVRGLIPATAMIDAVEWVATTSQTPNFGLLMAERVEPRIIGLPALIAEQSRSIADYYDVIAAHLGQHSTGYTFMLDQDGPGGVGRLRVLSRGLYEPRHFVEAVLAIQLRVFPQFLGPAWRPTKVLLAHAQLGRAGDYARAFGAQVVFEAGYNAIVFSADDLRWRAARQGNGVRHHLEHVAAATQRDLSSRVVTAIRTLLPTREATIEAVAAAMSINPRTLQRRLQRSGTSFSQLLAETRIELARDLLGREGISATETASRLGFAEPSVLSRFLRKRIGISPRRFRQNWR